MRPHERNAGAVLLGAAPTSRNGTVEDGLFATLPPGSRLLAAACCEEHRRRHYARQIPIEMRLGQRLKGETGAQETIDVG